MTFCYINSDCKQHYLKHAMFYNWQRIPVTEKSGRIHTSAVSVAILPQADEVNYCET